MYFKVFTIELDVDILRTGGIEEYPERTDSSEILKNILTSYLMYNYDLGYVQGMNNILFRIITIMNFNEVDSFWCFCRYMDTYGQGFSDPDRYMATQFNKLSQILKLLDSELVESLKEKGISDLVFTFQWILLGFEREFKHIEHLWDIKFSNLPHRYFDLFVAASIIIEHRDFIIEENSEFEAIYKVCSMFYTRLLL